MHRRVAAVAAATLGLLLTALPAAADQRYHTQSIAVAPVAGGGGSGTVTNIHANGPVNYGIERYRLREAAPRTTYWVALTVYADAACAVPALRFETAQLTTNGVGNGNGGAVFAAADVAPLVREPAVLNGRWTFALTKGGAAVYATGCVQIAVDVPPGAPAPVPTPQPSPSP